VVNIGSDAVTLDGILHAAAHTFNEHHGVRVGVSETQGTLS
jgi:hypothetical protein